MTTDTEETTELNRDVWGPTLPIETKGGLESRIEMTYPDWETGEKTLGDLDVVLREFLEMGRKRNPKKRKIKELARTWSEADLYCALLFLTRQCQPHPEITMDLDRNALYGAIGDVFGDGTVESGKRFKEEYAGTVTGMMEERDLLTTDDARPVKLVEVYGKWIYLLAEANGEYSQRRLLTEMLKRADHPHMVAQAVRPSISLYFGAKAAMKPIRDVFDVPDGKRAWRVTGNVACFAVEAMRGETNPEIRPHCKHKAMKAKSTSADEVAEELDHNELLAQTKYDGARVFVHHSGDGDVRVYSRGLRDVTAAMPEVHDLDLPDCAFMFDAEATPYDADGNVVPFEKIMTRLTRKGEVDADDRKYAAEFKVFDCMYWRGRDITAQKYTDRFKIVESVFEPHHVARTGEDLERTFYASLEAGHEGVIVKQRDADYTPGSRNTRWLKWKEEPETLDVEVIDVKRGGGRLKDRMGALRVGLDLDGTVVSVGRVGTGFSDEERLDWWNRHETGEAVGTLIEVAFEDFQVRSAGKSGGLRFPRFKRERPDGELDTVQRAARLVGREDELDSSLTDEDDGLEELFE